MDMSGILFFIFASCEPLTWSYFENERAVITRLYTHVSGLIAYESMFLQNDSSSSYVTSIVEVR